MGQADLSKLRILVVDSNPNMRRLITSILEALGITRLMEASDGAMALQILQTSKVDIAILDWHMEPVDGLVFLLSVRKGKDSPNPFLPIIIATRDSTTSTIKAARDAGASAFLVKPISVGTLKKRLMFLLRDERKFIRSSQYCGPDRRFHVFDGFPSRDRRGATADSRTKEPQKVHA